MSKYGDNKDGNKDDNAHDEGTRDGDDALSHPGYDYGELPFDLNESIEAVPTRGLELIHHRLQVVNVLRERAAQWEGERTSLCQSAGYCRP